MAGRSRPTTQHERDEIIRLRKADFTIEDIAAELRRAIGKVSAVLVEAGMHESKPYAPRKRGRHKPSSLVRARPAPHPHGIESNFIKSPTLEQLMSGRGLIPR